VKNRCKSAKEAKAEHLLFVSSVIFRWNKITFNDRNAPDEAISIGGCKRGALGAVSQQPEADGGSEAEPRMLRRFYNFFQKINIFRHIFSKFLL